MSEMPSEERCGRPKCYLLELPAELRDYIYELALVNESNIVIDPWDNPKAAQPSLTRVNRKIRDETLPMFYAKNSFEIDLKIYGFSRCAGDALRFPECFIPRLTRIFIRMCSHPDCLLALDLTDDIKGSCLSAEMDKNILEEECDEILVSHDEGREFLDELCAERGPGVKMTKADLEALLEAM